MINFYSNCHFYYSNQFKLEILREVSAIKFLKCNLVFHIFDVKKIWCVGCVHKKYESPKVVSQNWRELVFYNDRRFSLALNFRRIYFLARKSGNEDVKFEVYVAMEATIDRLEK